MLKHDAAVGAGRCNRLALDENTTAFDGQKPTDEIKQRRLSATGRPEQSQKFARPDFERNIRQSEHGPAARRAIGVIDPVDDDLALAVHLCLPTRSPGAPLGVVPDAFNSAP